MSLRNSQPVEFSPSIDSTTGGSVGCEAPILPPERVTTAPTHPSDAACVAGGFSFTGTAADHLQRTDRAIREARKGHKPVRDLLRRKRLLTARCAALGGERG